MATFYRGAGIGTYWHANDARLTGFLPHFPGALAGNAAVMGHIRNGTTTSPYISLTRSYAVARDYALVGRATPSRTTPAYVYEVSISDPPPTGMLLFDPVQQIASSCPGPLASPHYQHDGSQTFLLGVTSPTTMSHFLTAHISLPPPAGGTPRPANLSAELETMVRGLRDSEILVQAVIPSYCVTGRFDIF